MPRADPTLSAAAKDLKQELRQGAVAPELDGPIEAHHQFDFQNAALSDPKLQRFHKIWLSKCRPGRLPARGDFDPVDLPPDLLPWIAIVDVAGARFYIRLIGTGIVNAIHLEPTGLYLDELSNSEGFVARACWAVENARPFFLADMPVAWDKERFSRYSILCAPLAANGVDVDKLIYVVSFDR